MIVSPLLFTSCFMFMITLLSLGIIYGRFHWILKAILVASSLLFSGMAYKAYQNTMGYPAYVYTPNLFRLFAGIVNEPNPDANEPGRIYLWIAEPDQKEPRVVEIPYSKPNRDAVNKANEKIKKGETVYMTMDGSQDGEEGDGKGGKGKGKGKGTSTQSPGGTNTVPYNTTNRQLDFVPPPDTVPKK